MIGSESKQTRLATIYDVAGILEERKKAKDLTYEQQLALEHASKLVKSDEQAKKAKNELEKLGTLSEKTVVKLLEIMPKNVMLLKQVLAQEGKVFSEEELAKILAITKG
jgi:DNA-directed RNA polymerase subunit F